MRGRLVAAEESDELVCLGFKGDVPCRKVDVRVFDDGILISFSDNEPEEWRRAGDVLFGYDRSVNLLAIAIEHVSSSQIVRIREWLAED